MSLLENEFEMTNWVEVSASQRIEDDKCATDIEEPEADSRYYKSYGGIHEKSDPEVLLEFGEGKHGDENKATKSVEKSRSSNSRSKYINRQRKRRSTDPAGYQAKRLKIEGVSAITVIRKR